MLFRSMKDFINASPLRRFDHLMESARRLRDCAQSSGLDEILVRHKKPKRCDDDLFPTDEDLSGPRGMQQSLPCVSIPPDSLEDKKEEMSDSPLPSGESPPLPSVLLAASDAGDHGQGLPCPSKADALAGPTGATNDMNLALRELIKEYGNTDIYADVSASKRPRTSKLILGAFLLVISVTPFTQHNPHAPTGIRDARTKLVQVLEQDLAQVTDAGVRTQPFNAVALKFDHAAGADW